MTRSKPSGAGWQSVSEALRGLRQPLVALCALLLVANHLVPVASFAADASGFVCHGASQAAPEGDGAGDQHRFQTCCFSAAMGLLPAALTEPAGRPPCPSVSLPTTAAPLHSARATPSNRIRAPPLS